MRAFFSTLDGLLRGRYTRPEDLRQGKMLINARFLLFTGLILGGVYGIFMGLYGVLRPAGPSVGQLIASTTKVPLLFMLTLTVTFPSLYVFSTLVGSRLKFVETLRLLLVGIVVNLALLASFGPVTAFFTLCTSSYPFMIVLNVIFFALGGITGLIFMFKALKLVVESKALVEPEPSRVKKHPRARGRGPPMRRGTTTRKPSDLPRPFPMPSRRFHHLPTWTGRG